VIEYERKPRRNQYRDKKKQQKKLRKIEIERIMLIRRKRNSR
jgi:hypothetical protein